MSELKHYGVKGMKWGVRRDIKKRSIMGARIEQLISDDTHSIRRLTKTKSKRLAKGKSTAKIDKKIPKLESEIKLSEKVYKMTVKDLSQKDINKGREAIRTRQFIGASVAASTMAQFLPIGVGRGEVVRRAQNKKARHYVKKNVKK